MEVNLLDSKSSTSDHTRRRIKVSGLMVSEIINRHTKATVFHFTIEGIETFCGRHDAFPLPFMPPDKLNQLTYARVCKRCLTASWKASK